MQILVNHSRNFPTLAGICHPPINLALKKWLAVAWPGLSPVGRTLGCHDFRGISQIPRLEAGAQTGCDRHAGLEASVRDENSTTVISATR
jgi:hypothetical protein